MKFNYIETEFNGGNHWISDCGKYKIVHYDYYSTGGTCEKKSNYQAYKKISVCYSKKMLFGDRIDKSVKYYKTLKQAQKACIKYDQETSKND